MLVTLGRGMSGIAREQILNARCPLSSFFPSCVFDLDATLADSYSGSGTSWNNIVPAPADGSAQSAYHFMLGNGSTTTTYPTFTGSANSVDAYWLMDGGDYFTIQSGTNTSYLAGLQRTDISNQGYTVFMALRFANPDVVSLQTLFGTSGATSITGVRFLTLQSQDEALSLYQRGDSGNTTSGAPRPQLIAGNDYVIGVSRTSAGTTTRLWANGVSSEVSHTANTCTSNTAYPFQIGSNGQGGGRIVNTTRIYAVSMFNGFLTDAEAQKVMQAYRVRHGRSYL